MFKTLEGKSVVIELKNSLQLKGTLTSVDHFLNLKLDNVEVVDKENYPQLVSCRLLSVFLISGSALFRKSVLENLSLKVCWYLPPLTF